MADNSLAYFERLLGVLNRNPPDFLAGDDEFLDLRRTVTDLKPHDVDVALMERQIRRVAIVAMGQQALMDDLAGHFRHIPFAHRGFRGVSQAPVTQR